MNNIPKGFHAFGPSRPHLIVPDDHFEDCDACGRNFNCDEEDYETDKGGYEVLCGNCAPLIKDYPNKQC